MPNSPNPLVGIVMGSESDWEGFMEITWNRLREKGMYRTAKNVTSAHRTPDMVEEYARRAIREQIRVIIAGAGGAAHLPGKLKADLIKTDPETAIQVIGVPREPDALDSILLLPPGTPVIPTAPGKLGALQAADIAIELLAIAHPAIKTLLATARLEMRQASIGMDDRIAGL